MRHRKHILLLMIVCLSGSGVGRAGAESWTLDRDHTEVRFTWDHLGMSRQGGRFLDVTGRVEFDPETPETGRVEVAIPLAGISTGIAKLDEHLVKSKEFFDTAAFPAITFKSTGVRMKSDRTGEISGDLEINGISKPVVLEFVWNFTGEHPLAGINPAYAGRYSSGFSAATQIRRSDWGITRTIPYVSDEIRITIETEMHREGAAGDSTAAVAGPPAPDPTPEASDVPQGIGDQKIDDAP
jgi:polyisoprenoid-binding protein YceI